MKNMLSKAKDKISDFKDKAVDLKDEGVKTVKKIFSGNNGNKGSGDDDDSSGDGEEDLDMDVFEFGGPSPPEMPVSPPPVEGLADLDVFGFGISPPPPPDRPSYPGHPMSPDAPPEHPAPDSPGAPDAPPAVPAPDSPDSPGAPPAPGAPGPSVAEIHGKCIEQCNYFCNFGSPGCHDTCYDRCTTDSLPDSDITDPLTVAMCRCDMICEVLVRNRPIGDVGRAYARNHGGCPGLCGMPGNHILDACPERMKVTGEFDATKGQVAAMGAAHDSKQQAQLGAATIGGDDWQRSLSGAAPIASAAVVAMAIAAAAYVKALRAGAHRPVSGEKMSLTEVKTSSFGAAS